MNNNNETKKHCSNFSDEKELCIYCNAEAKWKLHSFRFNLISYWCEAHMNLSDSTRADIESRGFATYRFSSDGFPNETESLQ